MDWSRQKKNSGAEKVSHLSGSSSQRSDFRFRGSVFSRKVQSWLRNSQSTHLAAPSFTTQRLFRFLQASQGRFLEAFGSLDIERGSFLMTSASIAVRSMGETLSNQASWFLVGDVRNAISMVVSCGSWDQAC